MAVASGPSLFAASPGTSSLTDGAKRFPHCGARMRAAGVTDMSSSDDLHTQLATADGCWSAGCCCVSAAPHVIAGRTLSSPCRRGQPLRATLPAGLHCGFSAWRRSRPHNGSKIGGSSKYALVQRLGASANCWPIWPNELEVGWWSAAWTMRSERRSWDMSPQYSVGILYSRPDISCEVVRD